MSDPVIRKIEPPNACASAVATLESVLERARSGEISQVSIAYLGRDGGAGHEWSEGFALAPMLGAIHYMAAQFVAINGGHNHE